jgi:hypothetical protein
MRLKGLAFLGLAAFGLAVLAPSAHATPITKGTSVLVPGDPNINLSSSDFDTFDLVAKDTQTVSATGGNSFDLTSYVWRRTAGPFAGKLAFGWYINNVTTTAGLSQASFNNFSTLPTAGQEVYTYTGPAKPDALDPNPPTQTDPYVQNAALTKTPSLVSWDGTGTALSWFFVPLGIPGTGAIMQGQQSPILIFQTTATLFEKRGIAPIQFNNGNITVGVDPNFPNGPGTGNTYQPALVPEPTTLVLAFAGLPLLGLYTLRRRARA